MTVLGPYGYEGGLNTDASVLTLPKGQLSLLLGLKVSQGQLIPCAGFDQANIPAPPTAGSGTNYYNALLGCSLAGHNYLFLPVIGNGGGTTGLFYLEDYTGSWSSNIVGSSSFVGLFDTAYCIEVMNNVVFMGLQGAIINTSAPSGLIASWTGSGNLAEVTTQSGTSASGIIKQVNNFLFQLLSNGTLNWSNVGDGTTWTAGNSITFKYGDGDIGTALGKIGNTLYIFKMNCVGALQTTSVVLSGAVTLGPLYPVFDKIGTWSMRSIDNLPTGEIVFLGTNYNVYKFDGTNLTNLSNRPYPQSSIQGAINAFLLANQNISSNLLWVRVNPLENCLYLNMGGQTDFGTFTDFSCWAYDYVLDYWYQPLYTFNDFVYTNLIGNLGGFIPGSVSNLFLGLTQDGTAIESISSQYSTVARASKTSTAILSIPFTAEARDTVPRSLIISASTTNAANSLTISIEFDGVGSTSINLSFTQTNLQRFIVPLNFKDSAMTLQIQYTITSSHPFSISPLFIDTEIAH